MIDLELTYDEAYQFIKLYDILRDMDMPLTNKQMSVFEKVQDAQSYSRIREHNDRSKITTMEC